MTDPADFSFPEYENAQDAWVAGVAVGVCVRRGLDLHRGKTKLICKEVVRRANEEGVDLSVMEGLNKVAALADTVIDEHDTYLQWLEEEE